MPTWGGGAEEEKFAAHWMAIGPTKKKQPQTSWELPNSIAGTPKKQTLHCWSSFTVIWLGQI